MGKRIQRIGIDTGGTFTDFALIDKGVIRTLKVPSMPGDPAAPILRGLRELGLEGDELEVIHGTTVATNALLQRRGVRTALLTTAGFEDLLEIGRQDRPFLYRLRGGRPAPLVPRADRIGIRERIHADGSVEFVPTLAEMKEAFRRLAARGVEAVAICFLHSYRNPENELRAARCAPRRIFVSLSHRISPEYREFERFSTTVANAYLGPVLAPHLRGLAKSLRGVNLRVMTSNGGSASAARAGYEAVRTILSGPAGGVLGAARLGRIVNVRRLIAFDMGGTSTDVSLLDDGVRYSSEARVGGLPLRIPMIDIETVGAGGGSVARKDRGGALRVGPESAGSEPGPACYGRGKELTVTDANLFLGKLAPGDFLGGGMKIDPDRTADLFHRFARSFSRTPGEVAGAILAVANASMERAIRRVSVARGFDPARFLLVCYGGAAGLHACDLAVALQIPRILVPVHPGAFSAIGMLLSDARKDYSRTLLGDLESASPAAVERMFRSLEKEGEADLRQEGFRRSRIRYARSLDLRYAGQSYELNVIVPQVRSRGGRSRWMAAIRNAFHRRHRQAHGFARPDRPVELVNLRVQAIGLSGGEEMLPSHPAGKLPVRRISPDGYRMVRFGGGRRRVPVYHRDRLRPGDRWRGPAVVTEYSSTLFVNPGFRGSVDRYGNLILSR